MTEKERSRAKFLARVAQEQASNPYRRPRRVRRNADGRSPRSQRALERCARLVYDYDRDFEFESPDRIDQ